MMVVRVHSLEPNFLTLGDIMSKIPTRVKVKTKLKDSTTKKRFDLDDQGTMIKMEGYTFNVKDWSVKNNSLRLRSPDNSCIFTFDVNDVIDIDNLVLPPFPKPEIFNPDKLDI